MFTAEGKEDPYPALAELRRIAPVYYHEKLDTYFLTRFADCQQVLSDPSCLTPDLTWCETELPDWREHPAAVFFYSSLLRANGTDHVRLRRLVADRFSARRIAVLTERIETTTTALLDRFADATRDGGAADFQELVGYPLPVAVVGDLIGVPHTDQDRFHHYGQDASRLLEPVRTDEDWKRADEAVTALRGYFAQLVALRRRRPADDLVSALLAVREADDGRLAESELLDMLLLVFVAGFETTTSLLGLTVHALLSHPDQLALLREDPALVPNGVEESLRWDTPVRMTERIATRPLTVGGVAIPQGGNITTVLAAAGRDPRPASGPRRLRCAAARHPGAQLQRGCPLLPGRRPGPPRRRRRGTAVGGALPRTGPRPLPGAPGQHQPARLHPAAPCHFGLSGPRSDPGPQKGRP
ncbi:cytochrome P450 [Streptomyces murinus]|uniref:cytochrome P450 n=1 Tax=Streptomyces murinus TaxID=33900 RepID=UPI001603FFA7|nr:cytochrome P450 [Streptomyces murinus]MBA9049475.1 cytochrome P450 [Streptomyces murinus]